MIIIETSKTEIVTYKYDYLSVIDIKYGVFILKTTVSLE